MSHIKQPKGKINKVMVGFWVPYLIIVIGGIGWGVKHYLL